MLNEATYQEANSNDAGMAVTKAASEPRIKAPVEKSARTDAQAQDRGWGQRGSKAGLLKTIKPSNFQPETSGRVVAATVAQGDASPGEVTAAQTLAPMRADAQTGVLPLDMLCRAADNVRTRGTDEADGIPALAELIYSFGLINPLSVVDKTQGDDHRFPVAAGDRRLRALQMLAAQGRIRADEPIEVRRFPSQDALALSLAENTARLDMHPVDQFEAFRKLVEHEGQTIEAVADAYGVSVLTVRRRLALSKIAPELLELFRTGGIAQDQLQVLALAQDHATQVHLWHSSPSWSRSAYHLRTLVLAAEVSGRDHRAVYVGLDAYLAAGGTLRRDLFSDEDGTYLEDVTLLDRLYAEKLEAQAERLRSDGWAWVEVVDNLHGLYNFHRTAPTLREATENEAAQMSELELRLDSLDERLEKLGELIDESEDDSGQDDRLYDEQEALQEERGAVELQCEVLRDQRKVFSAEARALSGVRITAASGVLAIAAGLIRPADLVQPLQDAATAQATGGGAHDRAGEAQGKRVEGESGDDDAQGEDAGDGDDSDGKVSINGVAVEMSRYANSNVSSRSEGSQTVKAKPEYSEKVIADLSAHRTGALQAGLLDNQRVALATLAFSLLAHEERGDYRASSPAKVQGQTHLHTLRQKATGYDTSRAGLAMANAEARMYLLLGLNQEDRHGLQRSAGLPNTVFARLLALDLDPLVELLAYLSARTVDVIGPRSAAPDSADQLADALQLDMADYWQAGSDNFFIHVPKVKAIEAITQAASAKDAEPVAKMKKAEAASTAEKLVAGTRWLPLPLRRSVAATADMPSCVLSPVPDTALNGQSSAPAAALVGEGVDRPEAQDAQDAQEG